FYSLRLNFFADWEGRLAQRGPKARRVETDSGGALKSLFLSMSLPKNRAAFGRHALADGYPLCAKNKSGGPGPPLFVVKVCVVDQRPQMPWPD
ncbi:hypothetical protein, partial [Mesorhizobium sp. P5_C1]